MTEAVDHNPQYTIALATFTLQHKQPDKLAVVLDALLASYRRLKSGKRWAKFEAKYGLLGSVRALEVTYGVNGWHAHLHALLFFKSNGIDWHELTDVLKTRWQAVLAHSARTATYANGVDVRTANKDVASYVAKFGREPIDMRRPGRWTIEHEMTKAAVKKGRTAEGRTPMQLLADCMMGDKQAGELWKEYAMRFKGKRQLVWSRGLRKLLGIVVEKSDKDLATEEREDAHLLTTLTREEWRVVLRNDARGEVLEVASTGDRQKLEDYLVRIGARKARQAG